MSGSSHRTSSVVEADPHPTIYIRGVSARAICAGTICVALAACLIGCQTGSPSGDSPSAGGSDPRSARSAEVERLQSDLTAANHTNESLRAENHALRVRAERATAARDEITKLLEQRASESLKRPDVTVSPLSPDLDAALADFARQSGGQVSYDRDHAALHFGGDSTFEPGSDELRSELRRLLGAVASLAGRASDGYELFLIGLTDDAPIQQTETLARHPTNWHLAAHRAIAAKDALVAAGLADRRVTAAARGGATPGRQLSVFFVRKGELSSGSSNQ